LKDINNEKNDMKNLHFTTVKHCFFSNSMILIDVLSGNLLPLPYLYIGHSAAVPVELGTGMNWASHAWRPSLSIEP
jgi:hypothetical protein